MNTITGVRTVWLITLWTAFRICAQLVYAGSGGEVVQEVRKDHQKLFEVWVHYGIFLYRRPTPGTFLVVI